MISTFSATIEKNSEPHTHLVHELVIGRRGTAVVCVDEERFDISNRQTIFIPAGTSHRYELSGNGDFAEVTFVCFDNKPIERHLGPTIQSNFHSYLTTKVSSSPLHGVAGKETATLLEMMQRCCKQNAPFAQEKARTVLSSILVSHFTAINPSNSATCSDRNEKMSELLEWVEENLSEPISIDRAAARVHMSRSTFTRFFKYYSNVSFSTYVGNARLRNAASLLTDGDSPIGDIAYRSGFRNLGHFYSLFQKHYGMTPSQYRKVSVQMTAPFSNNASRWNR